MNVDAREKLARLSFLLQICDSWLVNTGLPAWWQTTLPTEPSWYPHVSLHNIYLFLNFLLYFISITYYKKVALFLHLFMLMSHNMNQPQV